MTTSLPRLATTLLLVALPWIFISHAHSTPRCEGKLLRTEITDRQNATLALLWQKKYAELQQRMDGFLGSYTEGKISDEELFYEFGAFDRWGPSIEPLIQGWITLYPRSFAALHALALYTNSSAWQSRGTELAGKTSPQQFEELRKRLRLARELSIRSLDLHPKPILAYQQLMANAKGLEFDLPIEASPSKESASKLPFSLIPRPDVLPILRESLRVQPDNTIVRETYATLLAPRWGGSLDSLVEFSKPSAHPGLSSDRLASVSFTATMEVASDYWFRKKLDEAVSVLETASRICRLNQPFVDIANIRLSQSRFEDALKAADSALSVVPTSSTGMLLKAKALRGLGKHTDAVRLLQRLAPEGLSEVSYLLGEYYAAGEGGLPHDISEARRLMGIAARAGNESARRRLHALN